MDFTTDFSVNQSFILIRFVEELRTRSKYERASIDDNYSDYS